MTHQTVSLGKYGKLFPTTFIFVTGERFLWQFHWTLIASVEVEAKELVSIAQGKNMKYIN